LNQALTIPWPFQIETNDAGSWVNSHVFQKIGAAQITAIAYADHLAEADMPGGGNLQHFPGMSTALGDESC
jgi:hypothetical protein